MRSKRTRCLNQKQIAHSGSASCVVYWMIRDHRVEDNWALLMAQEQALALSLPLVVVVTLRRDLADHAGTARMLEFMLGGLEAVEKQCRQNNIAFTLLLGDPVERIRSWVSEFRPNCIYVDFSPLRPYTHWISQIVRTTSIPVMQVDAHNCIPAWFTSDKKEWAARTIRPKIHRLLPEFLVPIPKLKRHPWLLEGVSHVNWSQIRSAIDVDDAVQPVQRPLPGTTSGMVAARAFVSDTLDHYATAKNNPTQPSTSGLSAYIHFGQISAQRLALLVEDSSAKQGSKDAFFEELIVRRELAENFCLYEPHYDSLAGAPEWAQKTLARHAIDPREIQYSLENLWNGQTHDQAWNAAQLQLLKTGTMHGYMRMYWAKKILEWSPSAAEAIGRSIHLNDRLQLDGRDPNGYVGILWSIAGLHDRPWFERPIFGTVRYMSAAGLQKKFDVQKYVRAWID